MSSWKKSLALILSLSMVIGILSGCSKPQQSGKTEGAQSSENVKVPENMNLTGYPIVKTPLTLKFFGVQSVYHGPWEDMYVFNEYEKKSGIHIQWDTVKPTGYLEQLNLRLASNELPDAFYRGRLSGMDISLYGSQQQTFIPLNDLVDKYAPNLKATMLKYPDVKKTLTAPDGKYYTLPEMTSYYPNINTFLWINQKWLDKTGMKMPNTTNEFYQVLTAFKEKDPNGNGKADEIPLEAATSRYLLPLLRGSFGIGSTCTDFELDKAGKMFYNKIDPRYKEVLEYLNKLYREGLMDKEAYSLNNAGAVAKIAQGIIGAYYYPNPDTAGLTGEKADEWVGMNMLKGPHEDIMYTDAGPRVADTGIGAFAISNVNKHPEVTIRWIDYWFGEEGNELLHGGQKGVHYDMTPDGTLIYKDIIAKDPKGVNNAVGSFSPWPGGMIPRVMDVKTDPSPKNFLNAVAARKKAEPYAPKDVWPSFILTPDEYNIMSSIGGDISKYANEMEAKFVTGKEPFTGWDSYVANIKKMGLDQVLKVQEAAYERYKNAK